MSRSSRLVFSVATSSAIVSALAGRSAAQEAPAAQEKPASPGPRAEQVNRAIDRGVAWLRSQQKPDGTFPCDHWTPIGSTALATYALLKSGVPPGDPAIQKAVAAFRYLPYEHTYVVSVEIAALDAYGVSGDKSMEETLLGGAKWLESRQLDDGTWGYPDKQPDLSNSQYAALGLWIAERHGFHAKRETWGRLLKEVARRQNEDGGFGYHEKDPSTGSMTTAGTAMLLLSLERVGDDARFGSARTKGKAALERGWKWLDEFFTVDGNPVGDRTISPAATLYYLFGLERVGAIGERRKIGDHDWYAEGARRLLRTQGKEGQWHDADATSFALLFLRRATFTGMKASGRDGVADAKGPEPGEPGEPHRPFAVAPFLRRFLVCGPIADPKDELLEAAYTGEENVEPKVGASFRGRSWTERRALADRVDLDAEKGAPERFVHYAFTWLHVERDVDALVWVGARGGAKLLVDGKPVLTRHVHAKLERDQASTPLKLAAGVHSLLLKAEGDRDDAGFFLRFAGAEGRAVREIWPSLSKSDPQRGATALSMPGLADLATLAASLPPLPKPVLTFDSRKELELLAFGAMSDGAEQYPEWIDAPAAAPRNPPPGARGILAIRPLREEAAGRVCFRANVPPQATKLALRVAPEGVGAPGRADFLLRAGVVDPAAAEHGGAEVKWLLEQGIGPARRDAPKGEEAWRTVEAPIGDLAGKAVLFVLECAGGGVEPWNYEFAYFDEIALR
jgi:hypothetical protein